MTVYTTFFKVTTASAEDLDNIHPQLQDWEEIEAYDSCDAAETYARDLYQVNAHDGPVSRVTVENELGELEEFSIDVDWEPTFSASKI
ncbi:MAG: hypothetical protein ACR2QF_03565 [Geminicoccaceae bacterium]